MIFGEMRGKITALAVSFGAVWRLGPMLQEAPSTDQAEPKPDGKLVGVQVIFRHGARTPISSIKSTRVPIPEPTWDPAMTTDVAETMVPFSICDLDGKPTTNDDIGKTIATYTLPGGARTGQLTRQGQQDIFELGRALRKRYVEEMKFIPAKFDPRHVYCRSTRYPRNITSSRCLLAGMFGRDGLAGDPPKIHLGEMGKEVLFIERRGCPYVWKNMTTYVLKDYPKGILALREKVTDVLGPESLTRVTNKPDGSKKRNVMHLHVVRDDFFSRKHHGFPIPDEIGRLMDDMQCKCAYEFAAGLMGPEECWGTIGLKAACGPMLQLIIDNVDAQLAGTSPRLHLYASHDDMLIVLMLAFDIFDGGWPHFGANIAVEVYATEKDHTVTLRYCGKVLARMDLSEFRAKVLALATSPEEHRRVCLTGQ